MNDTGEASPSAGWRVWAGVLAVLAIVAVGATVSVLHHFSAPVKASGHLAAPLSPSPLPGRSTTLVPPSLPSGQTCTTQAGRTLCGSYWFTDAPAGAMPSLHLSALASAVKAAPAPASADCSATTGGALNVCISSQVFAFPASAGPSDLPSLPDQHGPVPSARPEALAHDSAVRRLAGWDLYDAECMVVVDRLSAPEAVRRMGGDGKHIAADSEPGSPERSVTGVETVAGHTVLLMDNGWACNDAAVLQRLTAGGVTAVTAYWSADADTLLSYAKDGAVLATWDPIIDDRQGPRFDLVKAAATRVSADVAAHPNAAMVAAVAALTGVEVRDDGTPDFTVWLPNP